MAAPPSAAPSGRLRTWSIKRRSDHRKSPTSSTPFPTRIELPSPWHISIDTGGTFTDCLARDPAGTVHRAKVLSSGALRGRVIKQLDPSRLLVAADWQTVDDLVRGFTFRLFGDDAAIRVARSVAGEGLIVLGEPLRRDVEEGTAFEVRGDEPAPVLAARLVTQTPSGSPLPAMVMRLATTRGTNALLERRGAPTALFITTGSATCY